MRYRWAEPLKNNFVRVFKVNLAELLGTYRISVYPWPSGAVFEFQVSAEVTRYAPRPGARATLDVQCTIVRDYVPGGCSEPVDRLSTPTSRERIITPSRTPRA
ncbi:MAG: ABC-type transport auxiliary lipoprotein family protein [Deltaproteobacteria bacterium]|nr:ABC-type transport auxiliary lipoprotein family protein [Deltaproteobacteria bacterium]